MRKIILPYQRPALSKGFLAGEIEEKRLYLKSQDYFDKNNIRIIRNHKIVDIDRNNKTVLLENRKQIGYEKLVIATGSIVNKLKYKQHRYRVFIILEQFETLLK